MGQVLKNLVLPGVGRFTIMDDKVSERFCYFPSMCYNRIFSSSPQIVSLMIFFFRG